MNDCESIRPAFTESDAKFIVKKLFNIDAIAIEQMISYSDQNFKITCCIGSTERLLNLKILNTSDSKYPERIDAQNNILFSLRRKGIVCPVPFVSDIQRSTYFFVNSRNELFNSDYTSIDDSVKFSKETNHFITRLMEYIPGLTLASVESYTPDLLFNIGQYAACLDDALRDCNNPLFDTVETEWQLESYKSYAHLIDYVQDENVKESVKKVYKEFTEIILNENCLGKLQKGLIHKDLHEHNLLIAHSNDDKLSGVIDFDDMKYSYYLFELCTCIGDIIGDVLRKNLLHQKELLNEIEAGAHMIAGYVSKIQLSSHELSLLFACLKARCMQIIVNNSSQIVKQANNEYIQDFLMLNIKLLSIYDSYEEAKIYTIWREILDKTYSLKF